MCVCIYVHVFVYVRMYVSMYVYVCMYVCIKYKRKKQTHLFAADMLAQGSWPESHVSASPDAAMVSTTRHEYQQASVRIIQQGFFVHHALNF